MKRLCLFSVVVLLLIGSQLAMADAIRLGNSESVASGLAGTPGGTFANGTFTTIGTIPNSTGVFGANHPCGADSNTGANCSASWSFSYSSFSSVTSASVTLGLLGLD